MFGAGLKAVRPVACLSFVLMLAGIAQAQNASRSSSKTGSGSVTYRWVDEKGVVHYGDSVPPQYSQQERTILNNQGVPVGRVAAPKTPAELAAEEKEYQELLRKKQRDSFLLTTYTSVKDIEQLRDARLDQIKGQRAAAEQYIAGLQDRLLALQTRALRFKPYNEANNARRMPDDLAEDLVRTLNEMRAQQAVLKNKDSEESTLRTQFQTDIDRYNELRTPRTATR
jgi:hypothetical protein